MAQTWQTVRIFISSTFRDMQAERDHLVRFVFPRLREELLPRRIHLVDVDLRWGVTAEQDALQVCRDVVDECRPYFLCMLGGRYGWTPPGHEDSITAQEIQYAALDHPQDKPYHFFYFRDPAVTAGIPEPQPGAYREPPGSPAGRRLVTVKVKITDAGYRPYVYPCRWDSDQERLVDLEAFGERVYADLLGRLEAEFDAASPETLSEFEAEAAAIESFVETQVADYVVGDRQSIFERLHAHAAGKEDKGTLCLVGEPGSGKSALLAQFYRDQLARNDKRRQARKQLLIPHFVGASAASTNVRQLLRRLCRELIAATGSRQEKVPDEFEELCDAFPALLKRVAAKQRVVILIDAVDQLDPAHDAHTMRWLPQDLPEKAHVILTAAPGPVLDALRARRRPPLEVTLDPLSERDASTIMEKFLARYNKLLDTAQHSALLAKQGAGRPLYLLTALEELRTLGTYEEITDRIKALPDETQSLFLWILRRLEQDPGFRDASGQLVGQTLVRRYFTYLAAGRFGMAERELAELVAPGDLQGNIAALQRLVRPYLLQREALLDFAHRQLRAAVDAVYLDEVQEQLDAHRDLANYFRGQADPLGDGTWQDGSPRGLSELAYHLLQSQNLPELHTLYSDPAFLEAMCIWVNVRTLPGGEKEHGGIFELLSNLRGAMRLLETSPGTAPPHFESQLRTLFELFVERGQLLKKHPRTATQEIGNYIDILPDAPYAPSLLRKAQEQATPGLWLTDKTQITPPIAGHGSAVSTLTVSPSGKHFLSGGADGGVGYWQTDVARPLWLVSAHKSWVTWVALSPDGRRALSTGDDGTVFLWDVELGSPRSLPPLVISDSNIWPQAGFCAFLDDDTILVERRGGALAIDLRTESEIWGSTELILTWLRNYSEGARLDFSPLAGRLVISEKDIKVCDASKGKTLLTVPSTGTIRNLAISADGSRMVTADMQGRLTGYDPGTGQRIDSTTTNRILALCRAFSGPVFFGYEFGGHLLKIRLEDKLYVERSAALELEYPAPNVMRSLPDNRTLVVGRESGAITLFDADDARVRREWQPSSSLADGAIFPHGGGAVGIQGAKVAGEATLGNTILFIDPLGRKERVAESPHQHFISGVAALGPQQALTVDKGGIAVLWQEGNAVQVHEFPEVDFTACTAWPDAGLGVAGTQDERVIILGRKRKELPLVSTETHYEFRAGIAALAAAGEPLCVAATYFNGLVGFNGQGNTWRGPEDLRHSLRGTAVALDPSCTFAASGNMTGEVGLWRCQDGVRELDLALHEGEITALAFSSDGTILFTAGTDRFIYGISTANKNIVYATVAPLPPIALRAERDGLLFALDSGGSIYTFGVNTRSRPAPVRRENGWRNAIKQLFGQK